jgi:branched-chain amino acid transport system permease protein
VTVTDIAKTVPPPPRTGLNIKHSLRWPLGMLVAVVVIFVYYYMDTYFQKAVPGFLHDFMATWLPLLPINEALIYAMAALGLNVVVGYAGLLDLGFVAFWAIGGYTAGWLASGFFFNRDIHFFGSAFTAQSTGVHLTVWVVLIGAGILCAIAGIIIGAPTLRLRSDYLALVTLGFGEIIYEVFYNGDNLFGQNVSNGNRGINPVDSMRFFKFDNTGAITWGDVGPFDVLSKFVFFVILTAIVLFASIRIREGRLGRAWLAIREDELAASMMGVPLMRTKLSSYAFGAVAGGFAGTAFAVHVSGVFPDRFRFDISILLLAMVVLGGMGNVWGVTIGALLLAWTNSTGLPKAQNLITESGSKEEVGTILAVVGIGLIVGGLVLFLRRRAGLLMVFLGAPIALIGIVFFFSKHDTSFQFLIFGSVLIVMMLFRREGLIPEARTRLVLREPGRTEAEALGADMEDMAPELERLPDETVHAGGAVPVAPGAEEETR